MGKEFGPSGCEIIAQGILPEVRQIDLPASLSERQIQDAIEAIEDWEASHRSACELVSALYPILLPSSPRR